MTRTKLMICITLILAFVSTGCSKYKVYNMALNSRLNKADLVVKTTPISIGTIAYMDNSAEKDTGISQETILMVHGFGGDKYNWLQLSDELTDDYYIVAPDLPGHGDSVSDPSASYTVENQAAWLNEFMDKLSLKKVHVIGNSMGGAISAKLAHQHPEKLLSLTLMNSAGVYKTESEFNRLLKQGKNPLVVTTPDEYKHLLDFVMENKPYIPGPVIEVLTEKKIARSDLDTKIFEDISSDIKNMSDLLPEIKLPTLILWGDHDRVLHVDNADKFQSLIPGSKKVILKDIGHLPMIEDPKQTAEVYTDFLVNSK